MTYSVIRHFTDLQDNNHKYREGATYPREGYEPSAERIEELSTDKNRLKTPLIVPDLIVADEDTMEENEAAEAAAEVAAVESEVEDSDSEDDSETDAGEIEETPKKRNRKKAE